MGMAVMAAGNLYGDVYGPLLSCGGLLDKG